MATEVFNQCSKIEEKNKDPNQPGKKDFLVHFDYEFLEDFQDKPDLFSRISDLFKKYKCRLARLSFFFFVVVVVV